MTGWISLHHAAEGTPAHEENFWAYMDLCELVEDQPDLARDRSDDIVSRLAAGPLEDLLVDHGDRFIDRVEAEARNDPAFRHLLGGVWKREMSNSIWERVVATRGGPW